jgi:hypothetical protein
LRCHIGADGAGSLRAPDQLGHGRTELVGRLDRAAACEALVKAAVCGVQLRDRPDETDQRLARIGFRPRLGG